MLGRAYVSWAHNAADLLHGVEIGAEATVHCEDLLVNNSCNGQAVKAVSKGLPQLNVISSLALVVKAVDAVDRGAFVVTTEDEEVLWVFNLVCKQEADRLQRLLSSVDVVTQEEVVGFWWESTVFEESQEIVVLAVDIAANLKTPFVSDWPVKTAHCEPGMSGIRTLMGASSSRRIG